ncbi:MAG: carbon monoxide dehydrogenase subunit G [Pacificimonas sp.]|jgi:carbon monoxide dehydrogenase subunit G|nr:carbon monoxide dehydrogenase subunit G [Pacificimonas sp.]
MKITGEQIIAAPREAVWSALMDPDVLARCIDGVESLERKEGDRFAGTMNAKVGPVRAKFTGEVAIEDQRPPEHYVLRGEGKGGVAGFAKGAATVDLAEETAETTLLTYTAESQVGGKLAQIGSRLVEGAAKGYAERFFSNFKDIVEGAGADAQTAAAVEHGPESAVSQEPADIPPTDLSGLEDPARPRGSGLGMGGWAFLVAMIAAGIVAVQFL